MAEWQPPRVWDAAATGEAVVGDRIHSILRELRQKYSLERSELVAAVTEQVSDVKAELENARDATNETARRLQNVQKQLIAMTQSHDGPSDLSAATRDATSRLVSIDESVRRAADEAQLLKTALLNDRIRREERQRRFQVEDAEADVRLRQVEDSNAALRAELHTLKSVNVEMMQSVVDLVHECKYDAPTVQATEEMRALRDNVMDELRQLQAENAALRAKVDATVSYCENEEAKRAENVSNLEATVTELERRPPLPQTKLTLEPTRAADATVLAGSSARDHRAADGLVQTPRTGTAASTQVHPSLRERVAAFYSVFNPAKLQTLDAVLTEYEGAEEELLSALEVHYGVFGYFSSH